MNTNETKTAIHDSIARNAYTAAVGRYELIADVVRAMAGRESLCAGFDDDDDHVADACGEIVLHALAILRERSGMSPHASIASDAARRQSVHTFLRIIRSATDRLAERFDAPQGEPAPMACGACARIGTNDVGGPRVHAPGCPSK